MNSLSSLSKSLTKNLFYNNHSKYRISPINQIETSTNSQDKKNSTNSIYHTIESTINYIFKIVYNKEFPSILSINSKLFLQNINNKSEELIEKNMNNKFYNFQEIKSFLANSKDKILNLYNEEYSFLNETFLNYQKNPKKYELLQDKIYKHCYKDNNRYIFHKCNNPGKYGNFIKIKKNSQITYFICIKCKKCYKNNYINFYCKTCDKEYFRCININLNIYSNSNNIKIVSTNNSKDIFLATWKRYHCGLFNNEIMKCIKCKNYFYYNIETDKLICQNKKCNLTLNPKNILWKCVKCSKDFHSQVKPFNPYENRIYKKEINYIILNKNKAKPINISKCSNCGKSLNTNNITFYHNKYCKGELFKGILFRKEIIVCNKCQYTNYIDEFDWTCPFCNKSISNNNNKEKMENNNKVKKDFNKEKNLENKSSIGSSYLIKRNSTKDETEIKSNNNNNYDNITELYDYKSKRFSFFTKTTPIRPSLKNKNFKEINNKDDNKESINYLKTSSNVKGDSTYYSFYKFYNKGMYNSSNSILSNSNSLHNKDRKTFHSIIIKVKNRILNSMNKKKEEDKDEEDEDKRERSENQKKILFQNKERLNNNNKYRRIETDINKRKKEKKINENQDEHIKEEEKKKSKKRIYILRDKPKRNDIIKTKVLNNVNNLICVKKSLTKNNAMNDSKLYKKKEENNIITKNPLKELNMIGNYYIDKQKEKVISGPLNTDSIIYPKRIILRSNIFYNNNKNLEKNKINNNDNNKNNRNSYIKNNKEKNEYDDKNNNKNKDKDNNIPSIDYKNGKKLKYDNIYKKNENLNKDNNKNNIKDKNKKNNKFITINTDYKLKKYKKIYVDKINKIIKNNNNNNNKIYKTETKENKYNKINLKDNNIFKLKVNNKNNNKDINKDNKENNKDNNKDYNKDNYKDNNKNNNGDINKDINKDMNKDMNKKINYDNNKDKDINNDNNKDKDINHNNNKKSKFIFITKRKTLQNKININFSPKKDNKIFKKSITNIENKKENQINTNIIKDNKKDEEINTFETPSYKNRSSIRTRNNFHNSVKNTYSISSLINKNLQEFFDNNKFNQENNDNKEKDKMRVSLKKTFNVSGLNKNLQNILEDENNSNNNKINNLEKNEKKENEENDMDSFSSLRDEKKDSDLTEGEEEEEEKKDIINDSNIKKVIQHFAKRNSIVKILKDIGEEGEDGKNNNNKKNHIVLQGLIHHVNLISSPEKIGILEKQSIIPLFLDEEYDYLESIGEGSNGSVFLIRDKKTNKEYALKKMVCQAFDEILKIKDKLELIYSLDHENIMKIHKIQYKCLDFTTYAINIVMDRAISDWNKEITQRAKKKNFYTEKELVNIAQQIISSLAYLQKKYIAHRDIKPQNILIFENNIYKIADLGEMKGNISDIEDQMTIRGSTKFMSPALKDGLKYNQTGVKHNVFKSDVFSLGYCFLYAMSLDMEILEQASEFWGGNKDFKKIEIDIKKYIGKNKYSDKFIDFVGKMILENESQREDFLGLEKELKNFEI